MLNFKHLHYFLTVAKSGGVNRAAERLHLTPQMLSGQIGQLEQRLGTPLFHREGRRMEPTEVGKLALSYAEEIFQVSAELEARCATRRRNASSPSGLASPTWCQNPSPTSCWRPC